MLVAYNVANDAVNQRVEEAQFEQAKNVMVALERLINRIIYKPQSSGYVQTSFWNISPHFVQTGENLTITANGADLVSPIAANMFKMKGGPRTSVPSEDPDFDRYLMGDEKILLKNVSENLGRVEVVQSQGAWIILDYGRVRCVNAGVIEYYNGSDYEPYNLVELTIVNLVFGDVDVEEKSNIVAENKGLLSTQTEMSQGDFTLAVQLGSQYEACTLLELGGNVAYKSLLNTVVIDVELSIRGGT